MDMKISGSAQVAAGEYDNIRISGSGRICGRVRCTSFHCSGSAHGDVLECTEEFKVSGSCGFDRLTAKEMSVSGSIRCGGDVAVNECFKCSGSADIGGSLKCGQVSVSGGASVDGDIEAESVSVKGGIDCKGLINSENITIELARNMTIGSIGGSVIDITRRSTDPSGDIEVRFWGVSVHIGGKEAKRKGTLNVKNYIEGDRINLEWVRAPRVSGRAVVIGEGCEIELVQYSETIEVSPEAKVGRSEKI